MKRLATLAAALALTACASDQPQQAATQPVQLAATLTPSGEVPPNNSSGSGNAQVTYEKATHQLRWNVAYGGLTGPATAAHFHGPAGPGTNAPVVVNIAPSGPPTSPITGSAQLTDQQADQLLAGEWYLNVHTAQHKGGEIRGQVVSR